jgi:hypothetical protein
MRATCSDSALCNMRESVMSYAVFLGERPCPSCDAVGTLERVARSDWYACRSCTRTFLIHNGEIARKGTVGEPWQARVAVLCLCAALAWPSVAGAEMQRVAVQVGACEKNDCSKRAVSFYRSSSRHLVELRVRRHADNRTLTVTLYSDGFIIDGPAEIPHEGEDAFPVRTREYRRLAPGHYVVTAVLTTVTGQRISATPVEFVVLEGAH